MKIVVIQKGSINMTTYEHVTNVAVDYDTNRATISYGTASTVFVNLNTQMMFIIQY